MFGTSAISSGSAVSCALTSLSSTFRGLAAALGVAVGFFLREEAGEREGVDFFLLEAGDFFLEAGVFLRDDEGDFFREAGDFLADDGDFLREEAGDFLREEEGFAAVRERRPVVPTI